MEGLEIAFRRGRLFFCSFLAMSSKLRDTSTNQREGYLEDFKKLQRYLLRPPGPRKGQIRSLTFLDVPLARSTLLGLRLGLGALRVRGVVDFDLTLLTLVRKETFLESEARYSLLGVQRFVNPPQHSVN